MCIRDSDCITFLINAAGNNNVPKYAAPQSLIAIYNILLAISALFPPNIVLTSCSESHRLTNRAILMLVYIYFAASAILSEIAPAL